MNPNFSSAGRLIRLPEVMRLTAMSRSAIYRAEELGEFPPRCRVGARSVAWVEEEICAWITARAGARSAARS